MGKQIEAGMPRRDSTFAKPFLEGSAGDGKKDEKKTKIALRRLTALYRFPDVVMETGVCEYVSLQEINRITG